MFCTQFKNNTAKQWIDNCWVYYTKAGTVELFNDGYFLSLNSSQDRLCIYDISGCHAQLKLNNKYIRIMQEKEEYIAFKQLELIEDEHHAN